MTVFGRILGTYRSYADRIPAPMGDPAYIMHSVATTLAGSWKCLGPGAW